MKVKGVIVALIGLLIMGFGVGMMLYSLNSETSSWGYGYAMLAGGFLIVFSGLYLVYKAKETGDIEWVWF